MNWETIGVVFTFFCDFFNYLLCVLCHFDSPLVKICNMFVLLFYKILQKDVYSFLNNCSVSFDLS